MESLIYLHFCYSQMFELGDDSVALRSRGWGQDWTRGNEVEVVGAFTCKIVRLETTGVRVDSNIISWYHSNYSSLSSSVNLIIPTRTPRYFQRY